MANGNGRSGWQFAKDIIQYALIPLLGIGWWQLNENIQHNAQLLQTVSNNQIRVMSTVGMLENQIQQIEVDHAKTSAERARVHHTSNRSCLECKMQGMEHYPSITKPNSFTGK